MPHPIGEEADCLGKAGGSGQAAVEALRPGTGHEHRGHGRVCADQQAAMRGIGVQEQAIVDRERFAGAGAAGVQVA
jgi:hypothetical protein